MSVEQQGALASDDILRSLRKLKQITTGNNQRQDQLKELENRILNVNKNMPPVETGSNEGDAENKNNNNETQKEIRVLFATLQQLKQQIEANDPSSLIAQADNNRTNIAHHIATQANDMLSSRFGIQKPLF